MATLSDLGRATWHSTRTCVTRPSLPPHPAAFAQSYAEWCTLTVPLERLTRQGSHKTPPILMAAAAAAPRVTPSHVALDATLAATKPPSDEINNSHHRRHTPTL